VEIVAIIEDRKKRTMENTIICGLPLIVIGVSFYLGYLLGRYGLPVQWRGWKDRQEREV
jgi:hypothetical protein